MKLQKVKVELNSEERELIRTLLEEDESDCHEIFSEGKFEDGTAYRLTWFFEAGYSHSRVATLEFRIKGEKGSNYVVKDVWETLYYISANIGDVKYIAHIPLFDVFDFNSAKEELELSFDYFNFEIFENKVLYADFNEKQELIKTCYSYLHEYKFIRMESLINKDVVDLFKDKLAYYGYDHNTITKVYDYDTPNLNELFIHLTLDKLYNLNLYKSYNLDELFDKWLKEQYVF